MSLHSSSHFCSFSERFVGNGWELVDQLQINLFSQEKNDFFKPPFPLFGLSQILYKPPPSRLKA